jgi:hypothetical protein
MAQSSSPTLGEEFRVREIGKVAPRVILFIFTSLSVLKVGY